MLAQKLKSSAIRVLKEEAKAILALEPYINDDFVKACTTIMECKGKVVLTGVGKSGHIASKIASTLASTGTQAFFVQAGEAAHGDLGMIGDKDVVIAISNSGEGNELKLMIPILKRRGIPLIAIVGNAKSTLATSSDIVLIAHVEKEACPLNLAPTSSSTAELVMGDALAVALIEATGFNTNDFALHHPGGALGRRLLVRCSDLMHTGDALPIVHNDSSIKDTLIEMTQKGLGMVCVLDNNNKLCGIFTDGDLRRTLEKQIPIANKVCDVMSKNVVTLKAQTLAAQALKIMQERKINGFVVVDDDNNAVGAFNIHDLLRAGIL